MGIFNWDVFDPIFSLTELDDYVIADCNEFIDLSRSDRRISVTIPADNDALEGTEVLLLIPEDISIYDSSFSGNIFFQHTSIQIRDTTGN